MALVSNSFLLLVVRHLLLVAMHLFLVANLVTSSTSWVLHPLEGGENSEGHGPNSCIGETGSIQYNAMLWRPIHHFAPRFTSSPVFACVEVFDRGAWGVLSMSSQAFFRQFGHLRGRRLSRRSLAQRFVDGEEKTKLR